MFLTSLGIEKSLWEDVDFKTGSALLPEPLANSVAFGLVEGGGRLPGSETQAHTGADCQVLAKIRKRRQKVFLGEICEV